MLSSSDTSHYIIVITFFTFCTHIKQNATKLYWSEIPLQPLNEMKVKKTPHIYTAMNGCIVTNTSIYPKSKITFPFQQNTLKFRSRTNHLRQFQEILQTAYCCFSQFPVKWSNVSGWIIQILIKTTKELGFNLVLICMFGKKNQGFFYRFDSF